MKTEKLILTITFILLFLISKSEITIGPVDILFKPNSKTSFILYDNVKIDCGKPEGQWQPMAVYIPTTKEYFDGTKKLRKGDALIDAKGKKIGEIISDAVEYIPRGSKSTNTYNIQISGYIPIKNIRPNSAPEHALEDIITKNKENLCFKVFESYILNFEFREMNKFMLNTYPQYKEYHYEVWYFVDNNIDLIFEKEQLVAILHSRELKISLFEDIKMETNYIMWIKSSDKSGKEEFIANYKRFYETYE